MPEKVVVCPLMTAVQTRQGHQHLQKNPSCRSFHPPDDRDVREHYAQRGGEVHQCPDRFGSLKNFQKYNTNILKHTLAHHISFLLNCRSSF
jgi:hypothetical protein